MIKQRTLAFLAVLCLLAAGLVTLNDAIARQASVFGQLDLLVDVRHELIESYVEAPDDEEMVQAAVDAMVESLGDPYSTYFSPEAFEDFDRMTSGEFSGIGAEITIDNKQLQIVTPLEDSPAWHAGVMAGDIVLEIDGEPLTEIFAELDNREQMLKAAIERLLGDPGTDVTIKLRHESGEIEEVVITRDVILVQTVRGFRRSADHSYDFMLDDENRIGYVRLTQFGERTTEDLAAALDALLAQDVAGLIIDVRYDPGGLLSAAVDISDMFLSEGQTIVSVRGRSVPPQVYDASDKTKLPDQPIVILANEFSASASEILTGALADNQRALFVGTRTFGKGSVQQVKLLGDPSEPLGALKFTTAYYYGPSDRRIHKRDGVDIWGVDPTPGNYVPMTPQQRQDMADVRRNADKITAKDNDGNETPITPQWIEDKLKDPQLAAGLRAVLGKLETGVWPSVGQTDTESLVREGEIANLESRRELLTEAITEIDARITELKLPVEEATEDAAPTSADLEETAEQVEELIEATP